MTPPEARPVNALLGYFTGRAELAPPREIVLLSKHWQTGHTIVSKLDGMKWRCVASGRIPMSMTCVEETAEALTGLPWFLSWTPEYRKAQPS